MGVSSGTGLKVSAQCPFRVKSGRDVLKFRCLLYPRKQTWIGTVVMSALGQKRTHALQQSIATIERGTAEFLPAIGVDSIERRAQLMAHVSKELRLVLAGLFKLPALVLDLMEQTRIL